MATSSMCEKVLSSNDLPQILNKVSSISMGSVINFGLNLNVSRNIIAVFERKYSGDMRDCLREILNERLKQEPPLTWHDIITALRSPSVSEDHLARQIELSCMANFLGSSSTFMPATNTSTVSASEHPLTSEAVPITSQQSPAEYLNYHQPQLKPQCSLVHPHTYHCQPPPPQLYHTSQISQSPNTLPNLYAYQPPQISHRPLSNIPTPYTFVQTATQMHTPHYSRYGTYGDSRGLSEEPDPPVILTSDPLQDQHWRQSKTVQFIDHTTPLDQVPSSKRSGGRPSPTQATTMSSSTHTQSTAADHLPSATAISARRNQSKVLEKVVQKYNYPLTNIICQNLMYFTEKFKKEGFITGGEYHFISSNPKSSDRKKGRQLLKYLLVNCHIFGNQGWFDKFIDMFWPVAPDLVETIIRTTRTSSTAPCTVSISSGLPSMESLPSPVTSFIDYVRTIYQSTTVERDTSVVKWPPTPSTVYINLACIDRHSVSGSSREYVEVTEAMIRDGNVDVILNATKGPIDFNEIAKDISIDFHRTKRAKLVDKQSRFQVEMNNDERRLIVVEGAPGVGKSTFAWEFCRRWERGGIAQQYQLVLLLRLREERISNAKSLEDLIYHPLKDVSQKVCQELVCSRTFHALIILEGFDELPDSCRNRQSILWDLIAGKLLPLATVLVTSRPWATKEIHMNYGNRIYQHIEILGFTTCQITEYINSTVLEDNVSELRAYLECHPQIRAGMYIPLNSAIVVTVYQESLANGYAMPTTLTQLYTSLARTLLLRYQCGHPEYGSSCKYLKAFNELPPPIFTKFCDLCKLAYSGTLSTKFRTMKSYPMRELPSTPLPDYEDSFHVLSSLLGSHNSDEVKPKREPPSTPLPDYEDSFPGFENFTQSEDDFSDVVSSLGNHNSDEVKPKDVQSQLPICIGDQVQLIFRNLPPDFDDLGLMDSVTDLYVTHGVVTSYNFLHMTFQEFLTAVHISSMSPEKQIAHFVTHKEGRMRVVLRFLAGINKLSIFLRDECMYSFFQTPSEGVSSGYLMSCDAAVGIDLVQWLFEAQSAAVIEHVLGKKTIEFDLRFGTMLPSDYYCLGYCISHSQCHWVLRVGSSVLGKDEMKMLAVGTSAESCTSGRVVGLRDGTLSNFNLILTELNSIVIHHQLSLHLSDSYTESDHVIWPNLSALRVLELVISGKSNWKLKTLLPHLSLESLTIAPACYGTSLMYEDCNAISDHVKSATILKELRISSNEAFAIDICDEKGVEAITAALASNCSLPLDRLELEAQCTFTTTAADSLAQFITNTTKLKHLSIRKCTFSSYALLVLARSHNCLHARKSWNFLLAVHGDSEAKAFVQLLMDYPDMMANIECHKLFTGIDDAGAVTLAQSLHLKSSLRCLYLSNNSIGDAGAEALAQALHYNSTLTHLYLSSNSIGDAGTVAFAQALYHNSTLSALCMSNNCISDAGAAALAQVLHQNTTLKELKLSGNDKIGKEGIGVLLKALNVNKSMNCLILPRHCAEYAMQYHTVYKRTRYS